MNRHDKLKKALKQNFDEGNHYDQKKESQLTWVFNDEFQFEEKADKLINLQKKPYWRYTNTPYKKVLIAIIVFIIAISSTMVVPAFREPIIDFVVKQYDKFSSLFVHDESLKYSNEQLPVKIEKVYTPSLIPNDYKIIDYYTDDLNVFFLWSDESDNTIEFYQKVISSYNNLNTENTVMNEFSLGNYHVYSYTQTGVSSYIWYDKGYIFIINVPEKFPLEQVSDLINSVECDD